jgi:hypothetical protein
LSPNPDRGLTLPVHRHARAEAGVYLIENLALAEMARDRLASFCVILPATKFKGAARCVRSRWCRREPREGLHTGRPVPTCCRPPPPSFRLPARGTD